MTETPTTLSQEEILKEAMRHYDTLLAYAYGILRDWALAQDVVQDAIVLVNRKASEFKPGGNVFVWVRAIVKYTAWDAARKRRRETVCGNSELVQLVDKQMETYMDELSAARMQERKEQLLHCLEGLGERARSIILAFYGRMP
jgi:RNA polymerase sigma-70 factor, ECF subfamily